MLKHKTLSFRKLVLFLVFIIFGFDLHKDVTNIIRYQNWTVLSSLIVTLLATVIAIFFLRGIIKQVWFGFIAGREEAKKKFEQKQGDPDFSDAAIFSITWSREIYRSIPQDRKKLVKTSFTLIAIGLGVAIMNMQSINLITVSAVCALVLAGVNLLIWVVASEREEKNRIGIELETARRMQLSLMPQRFPEIAGFDIAGCCIPAYDVGGDLFDFIWTGNDQRRLCISVTDVSGKGMDAAWTAVYTSGALVTETQHEEDVVTVMNNLNSAILSRHHRTRFVSCLMSALDTANRRLEYVNAGQSKPLLLRDNQVTLLKGSGARFPLGVMASPSYQSTALELKSGDALLFYTDGATDAMNPNDEMFGEERLKQLFMEMAKQNLPAVVIVHGLKQAIIDFAGTAQQHDDLTLVMLKVLSHGPMLT